MAAPRGNPVLDFPLFTFVLGVWRLGPAAWTLRARGEAEGREAVLRIAEGRVLLSRAGREPVACAPEPDRPFLLAEDGTGVGVARQLAMRWDCAQPLKEFPLPPGYAFRHFKEGDLQELGALYLSTFGAGCDAEWYRRTFLGSMFFAPERVMIVTHGGRIVSTALAWEEGPMPDVKRGVLHFVATDPDHHDRGLAKIVSAAVLRHFSADGRREVVLTTDDYRIRAIRGYRTLGFVPVQDGDDLTRRWANVLAALEAGYLL